MIKITDYDKTYLNIAFPAAMEGVFMILLSNIDLIMVSSLGTLTIAAVSIFTQPRMIILCFSRSMAAVVSLISAKYFGMGNYGMIGDFLKKSIFVATIFLLVIHTIFYKFLSDILIWMGAEILYLDSAMNYAEIALISVFMTSLSSILQAVLIGFGQTRAVLVVNIQGNILNIIVSAILIFVVDMNVKGAAIGTVIGTIYTLFYTLYILRSDKFFNYGNFIPTRKFFSEFLPIFGGVFGEQGFERFGMVIYTRMIAELGTIPYAVHAICMNFCDFYYCFASGLGKASMVLAGQSIGKKNYFDWQYYLNSSIKFSMICSMFSFVLTFIFRDEIFAIYSNDVEASNLGSIIMIFVAVVSFPEAHAMICSGILRGSGKTTQVAIYSLISIAILRPIFTYYFVYILHFGITGAWLSLSIDQSLRAICSHTLVKNFFR